jgi:hypothetical protein
LLLGADGCRCISIFESAWATWSDIVAEKVRFF